MRFQLLIVLLAAMATARPTPHNHGVAEAPHERELDYSQLLAESGPPAASLLPHDRHNGGAHKDVVENILGFLSHEVRSVPDVSSRVVNGIKDFLSHETRDVLKKREASLEHPGDSVARTIVDFLASTAK